MLRWPQHLRMDEIYLWILFSLDFPFGYINIYKSAYKMVLYFSLACGLIFWLWKLSDWLMKLSVFRDAEKCWPTCYSFYSFISPLQSNDLEFWNHHFKKWWHKLDYQRGVAQSTILKLYPQHFGINDKDERW